MPKGKGMAGLLVALGKPGKGGEVPPPGDAPPVEPPAADAFRAASDRVFDAVTSGDRTAFMSAMRNAILAAREMPSPELDDEV